MTQTGHKTSSKHISETKCPENIYEFTSIIKKRMKDYGRRKNNRTIQAFKKKLVREADCDETFWCYIITGNSTLTIGLFYLSPHKNDENNEKYKTLQ